VRPPHYVHQDRYVPTAGRVMFPFSFHRSRTAFPGPLKRRGLGLCREGVGFVGLEPALDPVSGEGFVLIRISIFLRAIRAAQGCWVGVDAGRPQDSWLGLVEKPLFRTFLPFWARGFSL
jgi:hypothetical protein